MDTRDSVKADSANTKPFYCNTLRSSHVQTKMKEQLASSKQHSLAYSGTIIYLQLALTKLCIISIGKNTDINGDISRLPRRMFVVHMLDLDGVFG